MSNATKLPNHVREQNYIRQGNLVKGTPVALSNRQKRRLKRHDNLQKIQQVAKATFKEYTPTPEEETAVLELLEAAMDEFVEVDPPAEKRPCGGTEHCVTPSGKKTKTHKKCEASA